MATAQTGMRKADAIHMNSNEEVSSAHYQFNVALGGAPANLDAVGLTGVMRRLGLKGTFADAPVDGAGRVLLYYPEGASGWKGVEAVSISLAGSNGDGALVVGIYSKKPLSAEQYVQYAQRVVPKVFVHATRQENFANGNPAAA